MRRLIALLALLLAYPTLGCAGTGPLPAPPNAIPIEALPGGRADADIRVDDDTVVYDGLISAAAYTRLAQTLRAHPEITAMRVRSRGGDALPAIDMGELVRDRGLAIIVDRSCNSACANYLFVPATVRRILPGSAVMWHNACPQNVSLDTEFEKVLAGRVENIGGALRRGDRELTGEERDAVLREQGPKLRKQMRAYFQTYARRHQRFFAHAPVDSRVVCMGDYVSLPHGQGYGYALSADDMAAFGLCDIELPDDYAATVTRLAAEEGRSDRMGMIRLADYPDFHPKPRVACAPHVAAGAP
jgi:hypothetical protein